MLAPKCFGTSCWVWWNQPPPILQHSGLIGGHAFDFHLSVGVVESATPWFYHIVNGLIGCHVIDSNQDDDCFLYSTHNSFCATFTVQNLPCLVHSVFFSVCCYCVLFTVSCSLCHACCFILMVWRSLCHAHYVVLTEACSLCVDYCL